jgi:hypothetical protein
MLPRPCRFNFYRWFLCEDGGDTRKTKRGVFVFYFVVFVLLSFVLFILCIESSYAGGALMRGMTVFRTLGRR